jgi:S-(hydroxymethyl)glutathione dehydrogenase/alcohol dehydrogenase
VGCGVLTGVGAALRSSGLQAGQTVAVFGCGGVGLNVIQGAAIAGAERILAVDTVQAKLDMAKKFGATDTLLTAAGQDPTKDIKKLTGGGPDYAFECVGVGALAELAYKVIRRGGKAVVVGVARPADAASIRTMGMVFEEKTLQGSYFGSCVPRVDFPRMLQLYMAGKLKLDELITRRYRIDEAPQAFADMESGKNARGVIVF